MSDNSNVTSGRLTGRVKWFNNKTGFGFITVVGGNEVAKDATDVFVHHSAISVAQEQYRYLVQGEYVEFSLGTTSGGEHPYQAVEVRGVKGGKLFCETRLENRASAPTPQRPSRTNSSAGPTQRGPPRSTRGGKVEWLLVRRRTGDVPQEQQQENRGAPRGRGRGRPPRV